VLLMVFAYGLSVTGTAADTGWLHGLKVAAVAVVALALLGMARTLTPDRARASIAVLATAIALGLPTAWGQIGGIVLGAVAGTLLLRGDPIADHVVLACPVRRSAGAIALIVFFALLIGLPGLAALIPTQSIRLFDTFFRAGSLVFGGGHVILPLLQSAVVPPGWIGNDAFLAGYGAAQAIPGPLTTFAACLGTMIGGWTIAILCLIAIFLPSFLLVIGALPFWEALRQQPAVQAALRGVNAAVVGLLLAAFYQPVWLTGIRNAGDFGLAVAAFVLLFLWRTPPWLVVLLCAISGAILALPG
jgi:chromate transporter